MLESHDVVDVIWFASVYRKSAVFRIQLFSIWISIVCMCIFFAVLLLASRAFLLLFLSQWQFVYFLFVFNCFIFSLYFSACVRVLYSLFQFRLQRIQIRTLSSRISRLFTETEKAEEVYLYIRMHAILQLLGAGNFARLRELKIRFVSNIEKLLLRRCRTQELVLCTTQLYRVTHHIFKFYFIFFSIFLQNCFITYVLRYTGLTHVSTGYGASTKWTRKFSIGIFEFSLLCIQISLRLPFVRRFI